jgi:C4-dicarboxylate-specific signal transduction histidine kinase
MKITEKVFDITTGEETIIEREETNAEKKAREEFEAEVTQRQTDLEAKQTQRQEIANRLGLTADELKVLLG